MLRTKLGNILVLTIVLVIALSFAAYAQFDDDRVEIKTDLRDGITEIRIVWLMVI